jgi:hypothetical protein
MSASRDTLPAPPGDGLAAYAGELLVRLGRLDEASAGLRELAATMQAESDRLHAAREHILTLGGDP